MVFVKKELCAAKLGVVVEAHGVAVSASVVDNDDVAFSDFRKLTLYSKLITVFAEGTNNVINVVCRCIFLT